MTTPVVVTHYTDPWSVWCWAIEPQMLRLRERHGDQIQFVVRVGAIHETPAGPDFPRESIRGMFHAAKRSSGMPLDPDVITGWPGTTHRAGIAVKAAALAQPEHSDRYLRMLRYAAMVEARDIEDLKEQEEIARASGIDPRRILEAIETDEATRDFYSDQTEARVKGVSGFPTVTFRNAQGLEVGVGGFQPTEAYEAALAKVAGGRFVDSPPPDDLPDLLARRGPLATVEVAEVMDWLEDVATVHLLELEEEGLVTRVEAGGGLFWRAV